MIEVGCALINLETNEIVQIWDSAPSRIDIADVLRVDGAEIGWVSTDKKYKLGCLVTNAPEQPSYKIISQELAIQYTTISAKRVVATREYEYVPAVDLMQDYKDRVAEIDALQSVDDIKAFMKKALGNGPTAAIKKKQVKRKKSV